MINISSGAGSLGRRLDPAAPSNKIGMWGIEFSTSKAVLNLITAAQVVVYGAKEVKVFAVSLEFVVSGWDHIKLLVCDSSV